MPPKFENLATNQDIVKQELHTYRHVDIIG